MILIFKKKLSFLAKITVVQNSDLSETRARMQTIILLFLVFVKLRPDGEMCEKLCASAQADKPHSVPRKSNCACYSGKPRFGKNKRIASKVQEPLILDSHKKTLEQTNFWS